MLSSRIAPRNARPKRMLTPNAGEIIAQSQYYLLGEDW
jgi:hypothetical protein